MNGRRPTDIKTPEKLFLNLAIVGGGRTCKFFLDLFDSEVFPYLDINIVGVCDIDPEAEGLRMARNKGIYTTDNFRNLFSIKNLDYIIELTNNKQVLFDLIRMRPERVGIVEHNISHLFRDLVTVGNQLKSAEYQLTLEKMSSDFLIQQSDAAIVVINTDFTIVDANEAYLKSVDRSRKEVMGAHCYEILHGLNAPCAVANPILKCPMIETLKTGKSAHVIHELNGTRDLKSYGNIVTYPLKNQDGEISRVIEIWRDITEEISSRWQRRVAELKADLNKIVQEDRLISLGKLAASCVHQINNPLQGLLIFTGLMQNIVAEGTPSPEDLQDFRKHLALMSCELERCGKIVSGLLSFSRASTVEFTDLDLNEILKDIITPTKHKMDLQNIRLKTDFSARPLRVQGNANQLQQCFLNLIFNAIEAMPQGGRLEIVSKLNNKRKICRIEINDTGAGIPDEYVQHIFDPFFTTKEQGQGTGLGLSIAYGIIKNHRGNIKVNSRAGKGCSFIVNFPIL